MSRHQLDKRTDTPAPITDPEITVGWDAALRTFFLIVKDLEIERTSDEDPVLVWLGTSDQELSTVDALLRHTEPWAIIPARLRADLEEERRGDNRRGPHPMSGLFQ